jgi:hypothetical protein
MSISRNGHSNPLTSLLDHLSSSQPCVEGACQCREGVGSSSALVKHLANAN